MFVEYAIVVIETFIVNYYPFTNELPEKRSTIDIFIKLLLIFLKE